MSNPKPPTKCRRCRAIMRRWALDFRNPNTPEERRPLCLRIAKSFRNGWLACFPGQAHTQAEANRFHDLTQYPPAKREIEELNARLHSGPPSSHA